MKNSKEICFNVLHMSDLVFGSPTTVSAPDMPADDLTLGEKLGDSDNSSGVRLPVLLVVIMAGLLLCSACGHAAFSFLTQWQGLKCAKPGKKISPDLECPPKQPNLLADKVMQVQGHQHCLNCHFCKIVNERLCKFCCCTRAQSSQSKKSTKLWNSATAWKIVACG